METRYVVAEEEEIQRNWGLEAMTVMADAAVRLAKSGTVKEPYVGRFDMTTWKKQFLYAINPVGELVWQADLIGEDRNVPAPRASGVSDRLRATDRIAGASGHARARERNAAASNRARPAAGASESSDRLSATDIHSNVSSVVQPPAAKWVHQWEGPKTVGTGWQSFVDVFPAGYGATGNAAYGFSLFALARDGTLKWYRHDGFADGTVKWSAPVDVGTGWNSFKKVFAGGDGVMYAIGHDGALRWYRHQDVMNAKRPARWAGLLVTRDGVRAVDLGPVDGTAEAAQALLQDVEGLPCDRARPHPAGG